MCNTGKVGTQRQKTGHQRSERQAIELTSWNHNGTNGSQHRYHYPGMLRVQHRGGQSDHEKWNSEHNQWSRRLHDSQQRGTGCHDMSKHLGNDEQDTRSLRHKEHRLE